MDTFYSPRPSRFIETKQLSGDQYLLSQDASAFREGSGWNWQAGSLGYVLAGNQIVMKYWSHGLTIDQNGNWSGRDDAGGCGLWMYCEDETYRFFGAPSASIGTNPIFTLYTTYNFLTGTWTYVGAITPSQTVGITGTTTNNNANSGAVGEFVTATVIAGSAVALTTATSANVTSISLTAGDWDVWGVADFVPAATTSMTVLTCGLGTTSATLLTQTGGGGVGTDPLSSWKGAPTVPALFPISQILQPVRVSLSGTTTIYFVANATFTLSTMTVYGSIYARRKR